MASDTGHDPKCEPVPYMQAGNISVASLVGCTCGQQPQASNAADAGCLEGIPVSSCGVALPTVALLFSLVFFFFPFLCFVQIQHRPFAFALRQQSVVCPLGDGQDSPVLRRLAPADPAVIQALHLTACCLFHEVGETNSPVMVVGEKTVNRCKQIFVIGVPFVLPHLSTAVDVPVCTDVRGYSLGEIRLLGTQHIKFSSQCLRT